MKLKVKMPSLVSTLSIGSDKAAQLITNIQTTFKRRNGIIRREANISGHRFEGLLLTEPTKCFECHQLIWGLFGHQCGLCKLYCHKKCLQSINTSCGIDNVDSNDMTMSDHQFEIKTFLIPTMCDYCESLITGLFRQGVECSKCQKKVHHDCKILTPRNCGKNLESEHPGKNDSIYEHYSKLSIEDFEITHLLGHGSFAKVYIANLKQCQSESFAIKVIKKTTMAVNSDPDSVFTEWKALNMGRKYPFLTIGHCCFQSEDRLYFVMEYVLGRDLVYHIEHARKFPEYRSMFYSAEIFLALTYLHSQRLIYRDLKLDNIILDKFGHCKLIDFGMSKILSSDTMKTRTFCGTPSYISPEILRGESYDYSVDWWSFGVLLFEMLVGSSPFYGQTENDIYDAILTSDIDYPKSLSDRARSILEGLLIKDPRMRLGCQLMEGCSKAIRDHPFFLFKTSDGSERFRWDEIECKNIEPPYKPNVRDHVELYNESEQLELSPISSNQLRAISQSDFENFSFYSESFEGLANVT